MGPAWMSQGSGHSPRDGEPAPSLADDHAFRAEGPRVAGALAAVGTPASPGRICRRPARPIVGNPTKPQSRWRRLSRPILPSVAQKDPRSRGGRAFRPRFFEDPRQNGRDTNADRRLGRTDFHRAARVRRQRVRLDRRQDDLVRRCSTASSPPASTRSTPPTSIRPGRPATRAASRRRSSANG